MKTRQKAGNARLNAAAVRTGRVLGTVARTVDGVKARHPHPLDEAREALAAGRKRVAKTSAVAAKKTDKVVKRVKKAVKGAREAVKDAQKAVKGARKAVKRRASRLMKR